MTTIEAMKMLQDTLSIATKAYDEGHPIMSDKEWDDKYFELKKMELEHGFTLPFSPTQVIEYKVVNQLEKVEHNHPMLSLAKTKDVNEVKKFIGDNDYLAMCKMDGLTLSLRYDNGKLVSAETRGNGKVGEDVLHNALVIPSIPKFISYIGELVIDGEIICKYDDFEEFNNEYKNPRNFAAGSIRLLDPNECRKRKLTFVAWDVIKGLNNLSTLIDKLIMLRNEFGFTIVPFTDFEDIDQCIENLNKCARALAYPIDGIVFKFNNIEYGKSLGATAHHFNNAIAYKFYDETYPTLLKSIEWTMGRTGVLTPVAIFDPVDIEGSEISRASLHNISIMQEIFHGELPFIDQKIEIYRANMIIPQVYCAEEIETFSHYPDLSFIDLPEKCPICGMNTEIKDNNGVRTLYCSNAKCEGKFINKLNHFCGKKGLDIKGLSSATLEKLIEWEWVKDLEDIFLLENIKELWMKKSGFGEKSVNKIIDAIEKAKNCTLESFISSLGIPLIGNNVAKDLVKHIDNYEDFRNKVNDKWSFSTIENFGEAKENSILNFDYSEADKIYKYLNISKQENTSNNTKEIANTNLTGMTFVITGKLKLFTNRDTIKNFIEQHGGKVTGSVSRKTTYLINNDKESTSTKNKTAIEYQIPIITEEEFMKL